MSAVLERATTIERGARPGISRCLDMSITDLEVCLLGVAYPAEKQDLIEKAKLNSATDDVMAFLRLLPKCKYYQFHDIAFMAWSFLLV